MRKFFVLLRKELRELLTPVVIVPFIAIISVFALLGQVVNIEEDDVSKPLDVLVIDEDESELSNGLIMMFEDHGFLVEDYEGDNIDEAINYARTNDFIALLKIPQGFEAKIIALEKPQIQVYNFLQGFSILASMNVSRVDRLKEAVNDILSNELISKNIEGADPEIIKRPVEMDDFVVIENRKANVGMNEVMGFVQSQSFIVPIILFIVIVFAAQMVAVTIATEKENKTFEVLLSSPINRKVIIVTKILASGLVALIFSLVYMFAFKSYMSGFGGMGVVTDSVDAYKELGVYVSPIGYVLIGLSLFFSTLCALAIAIILGIFAEDVKGVQMVTVPLMIFILIPYFITMFVDVRELTPIIKYLIYAIPFTHSFLAVQEVMLQHHAFIIYGILYQVAVFGFFVVLASKIFSSEKVLTLRLGALKKGGEMVLGMKGGVKGSKQTKKNISKKIIGLIAGVLTVFIVGSALIFSGIFKGDDLVGKHYEGYVWVQGMMVETVIDWKVKDDVVEGEVFFPEQSDNGVVITDSSLEYPKIYFELGRINASFDGEIVEDVITGFYEQNGVEGTFKLKRGELDIKDVDLGDKDYREEEITFNNGDIVLTGTLSVPLKEGRHPAIVFISGSGAQDRDENVFGFKIFEILAHNLSNNGIAVLRYDDRGIGGSTLDITSTSEDFAEDVKAAVEVLKSRDDINPEQIGLLGHSEGAAVAAILSKENKNIAFFIFMGGYCVSGEDINLFQVEDAMRQFNFSEDRIKETMDVQKDIIKAVKTGRGWEQVEEKLIELLSKDYPGLESIIKQQVELTLAPVKTPWFKFFVEYNPSRDIQNIDAPVLVLYGSLDTQVPVESNIKAFEDALRKGNNNDYTIKVFEGANHLFQEAMFGTVDEYPILERKFVDGFTDLVTEWIVSRVDVVE